MNVSERPNVSGLSKWSQLSFMWFQPLVNRFLTLCDFYLFRLLCSLWKKCMFILDNFENTEKCKENKITYNSTTFLYTFIHVYY